MIIIAFCGKAQCGKSSSLQFAQQYLPDILESRTIRTVPVIFAEKLKSIALDLFRWSRSKEEIYTVSGRVEDEGRRLLINIGQAMRSIRPTVWCDYIRDKIQAEIDMGIGQDSIYICDDARFINEMNTFKGLCERNNGSFYKVKIVRDKALDINDISERDLDGFIGFDFTISNNDSLDALRDSVVNILGDIRDREFGTLHK